MSRGDRVEVTAAVAAAAGTLYELVADVERMGSWSPETTRVRWVGGTPGGVGARFRGSNRHGLWRWSTTCRVSTAEPAECFGFEVSYLGRPIAYWEYRFRPTDSGCEVTETWIDRRGPVMRWIGTVGTGVPDRPGHNRRSMEATLAALAAAATPRPD